MDKNTSNEILETVKELKEFSKVCLNVAAWVEGVKAKIMQWENIRENAEMLARQAQADLEAKQAEAMAELHRLPNELAPLRNKIAQQERDANRIMAEATLRLKEAGAVLEQARAKAATSEPVTASEVVAAEKRSPGRPKKEHKGE